MKAFIAYRHTGEKPDYLDKLLSTARNALRQAGIEAYCTFFDEDKFQDKALMAHQIMDHAFSIIDQSDFLFVLQTSENKSEGMLMEVGYCKAKGIPVVIAAKNGIGLTYLPDMGEVTLRWDDLEDLGAKITQLDLQPLAV